MLSKNMLICAKEKSLKRNTLLFWAYNHLAKLYVDKKQYQQALFVWHKAFPLLMTPKSRIRLGEEMLGTINQSSLRLSEKAFYVAETAKSLQEAYRSAKQPDKEQQMSRLRQTAEVIVSKKH